MSAFAGLIRADDSSDLNRDIDRMARSLPDFDGGKTISWTSGRAGLAYKPFVITPEDRFERQPWIGHGGRSRLVFAGRLDNREALADSLGLAGPDLSKTADGALCLAALERWDLEAPARMIGGFSFALWREDQHRLLLCRDPMGGRPLFFHRGNGFVAFSNSFNSLFALPQVPREIDEVVLGDVLALNTFEQNRTLYHGVQRVPSGCYAVWTGGEVKVATYWAPQRRDLGLKRHEDYVEAAREQLDRSVRPMLRSERPIAVQCSGGLDSPAVAATAARLLSPSRLTVVTRVPGTGRSRPDDDRRRFDEGPAVRALAAMHPNMDLIEVDDDDLHPVDLNPAMRFVANGIPVFNPLNHGWFSATIDRVKSGGHRVLLDGGWGNYSLGWGASTSLHGHLLNGSLGRLTHEVLATARVNDRPLWSVLRRRVLRRLEPDWLQRLLRRRRGLGEGLAHGGFVDPEFMRQNELVDRIAAGSGWRIGRLHADPFVARSQWLVRSNEIGRDWTGQAPAFMGHEKRDPLGDPRLIEFCLNVPEEHYLRNGWTRALARDVIADRTPPEIHANLKFGVQNAEWFHRLTLQRDAMMADLERIAASPLASRMIDMKRLRAALADWPATAEEAEPLKGELGAGLTRAMQIGRFICWVEGGNG